MAGIEKTNTSDSFQMQQAALLYERLYPYLEDLATPMAAQQAAGSLVVRDPKATARTVLDRFAVRWLATTRDTGLEGSQGLRSVLEVGPGVHLIENTTALPRCYVVPRVECVSLQHGPEYDILAGSTRARWSSCGETPCHPASGNPSRQGPGPPTTPTASWSGSRHEPRVFLWWRTRGCRDGSQPSTVGRKPSSRATSGSRPCRCVTPVGTRSCCGMTRRDGESASSRRCAALALGGVRRSMRVGPALRREVKEVAGSAGATAAHSGSAQTQP